MRKSLKQVLMDRDGVSSDMADILIDEARRELFLLIENDDDGAHDICQEHFGLEPDYIEDLM